MRARDLFYALWTPDLFMERVEANAEWSLFCPNECPGLFDTYGDEFRALYAKYESEGRARRTVKARELWDAITQSQIETGTPYMLYKDACNEQSNQKNLGTIRSSNLCTEIIEYTAPDEVAVCNLASIALPKFVNTKKTDYDYKKLYETAKLATKNVDQVIDINDYPTKKTNKSNNLHRPVGLGIQGLADVLFILKIPHDGEKAAKINKRIFETKHLLNKTYKEIAKEEGISFQRVSQIDNRSIDNLKSQLKNCYEAA